MEIDVNVPRKQLRSPPSSFTAFLPPMTVVVAEAMVAVVQRRHDRRRDRRERTLPRASLRR